MKNQTFRFLYSLWNRDLGWAFLLVGASSVLEVAAGSASLREGCNAFPRVEAVLADGHRILPWGMEPVGVALAEQFRQIDIELVLSPAIGPPPQQSVIHVNLLPHPPTDWGLSAKALGAVRRGEASSSPVFIFYPSIERVLGTPSDTPRILDQAIPPAKWIHALARIIAHEILHVLLPERTHDRSGIFAANFKRNTLLSRELELEDQTRAALADRLCPKAAP
jgi:hypothetical protein